jgi:hypothetical protein
MFLRFMGSKLVHTTLNYSFQATTAFDLTTARTDG